jgi:hypothetical protein
VPLGAAWLLAIGLGAATARAQPSERPPLPQHLAPVTVSVGGQAAALSGDACTREASDVVGCVSNLGYAGAHLATRFRVHPSWSIGIRGSGSTGGSHRSVWQASGLVRWHAFGAAYPDLFLELDAGVVAFAESLDPDELGPATTVTREAPILGLSTGVDFPVATFLTVGPALRALVIPFGQMDPMPDRGTSYSTQLGAELGVSATVLLGG